MPQDRLILPGIPFSLASRPLRRPALPDVQDLLDGIAQVSFRRRDGPPHCLLLGLRGATPVLLDAPTREMRLPLTDAFAVRVLPPA